MVDLSNHKLLIIGGAFQHCKLVEAARNMGVTTYVVDYLPVEKAPAKQIADYHYEYNITDYDEIVALCKREHIDGALSAYLDACQIPYQEICERMGYPCFGSKEQFRLLTDKTAFIRKCIECGVDVIPQYTEQDFSREEDCPAEFPVFVKPCDSRGSRGQTICRSFAEMSDAVAFAKSESKTGNVIIEKFMGDKQDFSMSYLVIDGVPHLVRTGDRYVGAPETKMNKSAICGVSPSGYLDLYLNKIDEKIKRFISAVGIKNGPVFMQGFVDGDVIRFYDPGLRFPGIEYDRMYEKATGTNICKALVLYALTGAIPADHVASDPVASLNGKRAADLFIVLKPGVIRRIEGLSDIMSDERIISFFQKATIGDRIEACYNVNQRFGEFDIVAENTRELANIIDHIYEKLHVYDTDGNDMIFAQFDTRKLKEVIVK